VIYPTLVSCELILSRSDRATREIERRREREMHPQKKSMLWFNVLGGIGVLGSYAYSLWTHPGGGEALWGGVPEEIRPFYTAGMLAAALGYFAFTYFVLFRLDPDETRVWKRLGFGVFNGLYIAILLPSALWMPLTFRMVERPDALLWVLIRLVLGTVGLGSVGLVVALAKVEPREPTWAYRLAVAGSVAFCLHTGVLDALVWPAYFPA
jgi:hypothetical protein